MPFPLIFFSCNYKENGYIVSTYILILDIMKPKKTWIVSHLGTNFKYRIYDTFAFDQEAIRVVCPWVGLNSIFDLSDEAMVINEIIPSYIELKQENIKKATLQIRLKASDKE